MDKCHAPSSRSLNSFDSIVPSDVLGGTALADLLMRALTPSRSGDNFHLNVAVFAAYHFAESGCVGEIISIFTLNPIEAAGAGSGLPAAGAGTGEGELAASHKAKEDFPDSESTFVPFPSAARIDAPVMDRAALPALTTLNVIFS